MLHQIKKYYLVSIKLKWVFYVLNDQSNDIQWLIIFIQLNIQLSTQYSTFHSLIYSTHHHLPMMDKKDSKSRWINCVNWLKCLQTGHIHQNMKNVLLKNIA